MITCMSCYFPESGSLPLFTLGRMEKFAIGGNGNVEMRGGNVPGGERGGRYST